MFRLLKILAKHHSGEITPNFYLDKSNEVPGIDNIKGAF